jgi:nucleoside-diphosphate-sugar epimerase
VNSSLNLQGAKVLVTGATGFIGGRLTDYLTLHYKANVRALVRNYGRAVHLARYGTELIPGDLLNPESLSKAAAGCDVVFHCAFGAVGEDDERRNVTVDGTKHVLEAALAAGVKRFVHVSTVSVHGADPGPVIDENTPLAYTGELYGDAKIDAEKLVLHYVHEKGLPAVIVRPTIVYGPRAGGWTIGPVTNMKRGQFTLIEHGSGVANHVYVDDVVQGLLLAAVRPNINGEAFLLSQGSGVAWKEFFGYYARLLGVELPNLTRQMIQEQQAQMAQLRNPLHWGISFVSSPRAQSIARQLPGVGAALGVAGKTLPRRWQTALLDHSTKMRAVKLNPPVLPRPWIVDLFCAQGLCKIDKAQRMLGYQPQVGLAQGMRLTESWLRDMCMI